MRERCIKIIHAIKLWWFFWQRGEKYNNPIYKEYLYWHDRIKAWWNAKALSKAKKLAIARHKADGRTYYVLPDNKGVPRSFNNKEITVLKAHGLISKNVTCLDLYREAMFIANAQTINNSK